MSIASSLNRHLIGNDCINPHDTIVSIVSIAIDCKQKNQKLPLINLLFLLHCVRLKGSRRQFILLLSFFLLNKRVTKNFAIRLSFGKYGVPNRYPAYLSYHVWLVCDDHHEIHQPNEDNIG